MVDKKLSELSQEELVKLAENQAATIILKDKEIATAGKSIADLNEKVGAADKGHAATKKELEATVKINTALTKKIEQLPKKESKSSIPSFSLDDVDYEFAYPKTVIGGKTITIADVQASESLQREMVARNSGMIRVRK